VARLVRSRPFRRIVAVAALLSLFTVSDGFVYLAVLRRDDIVATVFPLLAVGTSLGYLLLGVPFGRLADRWGRRRVFLFGHLPLLGCYAAAVGPVSGTAAAVVSVGFLGAYYAATDGVLSAAAVPLLPATLRASGLAALQTAVALANLVSSIGFGVLYTVLPAGTAFMVMAAGTVTSIAVAFVLLRAAEPGEVPT
jgi:MFS family permease